MKPAARAATRWTASFFGVGFIPLGPGTWASAAAAALAWFFLPAAWIPWAAAGTSAVGLALCAPSRKAFGHDDPHAFVLDEVAGMLLSVMWLPKAFGIYLAAFVLFRLLDICKPGPLGTIQRHPHPFSIMGDDMLAGVMVNGVLQIIGFYTGG